jgi:hypothetical protein
VGLIAVPGILQRRSCHKHAAAESSAQDQEGGSDSGKEDRCVRGHALVSNLANERASPEPVPAWEKQEVMLWPLNGLVEQARRTRVADRCELPQWLPIPRQGRCRPVTSDFMCALARMGTSAILYAPHMLDSVGLEQDGPAPSWARTK